MMPSALCCLHRHCGAIRTAVFAIPLIGVLLALCPDQAVAGPCSPADAAQIAASRFGGQALSVSTDGAHFIVRLRLPDGYVIDVAVGRDSC